VPCLPCRAPSALVSIEGFIETFSSKSIICKSSPLSVLNIHSLVLPTDTDDAAFVNLEDLAGTVKLGHINATPANLFDGIMGLVYFTQIQLTAAQIKNIDRLLKAAMGKI